MGCNVWLLVGVLLVVGLELVSAQSSTGIGITMLTSFEQSGAGTFGPYQPELGIFIAAGWFGWVVSRRVGMYMETVSDMSSGGEGGNTVKACCGAEVNCHDLVS